MKQVNDARAVWSAACDAVYALALPRTDVKFRDCLALCPDTARTYEAARAALDAMEASAIAEGRAWRSAAGLSWYHPNGRKLAMGRRA